MRRYLHHGTSLCRWRDLDGLGYAKTLYLSGTVEGTRMYRHNAVEMDDIEGGNQEVVITFEIAALERLGDLEPDWDDVASNMELFPEAFEAYQVAWQESLRKLGTCAYSGPIRGAVVKVRVFR